MRDTAKALREAATLLDDAADRAETATTGGGLARGLPRQVSVQRKQYFPIPDPRPTAPPTSARRT